LPFSHCSHDGWPAKAVALPATQAKHAAAPVES
jgi:hypothetical protein